MAIRNFFIGSIAAILLAFGRKNPLKVIPKHLYKDLVIRVIAGQLSLGLFNFSFSLIEMGTASVLFGTNPFWISILSCIILRERVQLLEIAGIFVSFGGLVMLGIGKQKRINDAAAELAMQAGLEEA